MITMLQGRIAKPRVPWDPIDGMHGNLAAAENLACTMGFAGYSSLTGRMSGSRWNL
jgi:hypothetical protein